MSRLLKNLNIINLRTLNLLILSGLVVSLATCKKSDTSGAQTTGSSAPLVLNKAALTMLPGQIDTLVATIGTAKPIPKSLIWASSNKLIATVDTLGHVTAQSPGTATITVETVGTLLTAQCSVTVNAIPATALTLNINSFGMYVNEAFHLTTTLVPSNASPQQLVWTSSNTAVATVNSSGLVTGQSPGNAVITVKTADGKLSATCSFGIIYGTLTAINLNQTNLSLVINSSYTLKVSIVSPYSPPQQFVWNSSNPSVATVSTTGVISTNATIGKTTVTVSTADGKFTATCLVTVSANSATGIKLDSTQFLLLNGTQLTMGYVLSPLGVTNTALTWTSSNTAVATVNTSGIISGLIAGRSNITAQTNPGGFTSTCSVQVVPIGSFLESYFSYTGSTATGQLVETVSVGTLNYSLYDITVTEIDILNNENNIIGSLKGSPLYTIKHAAGNNTLSPSQSFIVSQAEPGATDDQQWPAVVYFTCNSVNYKMTLTLDTNDEPSANAVIVPN